MKNSCKDYAFGVNWILLGLLMLVPGIIKLFVFKPSGVNMMLSGLGFPLAGLFTWLLIIAEIGSGIAILAKWKIKYVVFLPIIVLVVAAFTTSWGSWPTFLLHLTAASNYWVFAHLKK